MISDGGRFMVERCWGAEKTLDFQALVDSGCDQTPELRDVGE